MVEYENERMARMVMIQKLPKWCGDCHKAGDCDDANELTALDRCAYVVREINRLKLFDVIAMRIEMEGEAR